MIKNLSLTILIDNNENRSGLPLNAEHGLSLWIEADEQKILFDAGQSNKCIQNADMLGLDLKKADMLILSHGHYDHTGAIPEVLSRRPDLSIFCSSMIFTERYSRQMDGSMKPIGINKSVSDVLIRSAENIHFVNHSCKLSEDFGILTAIRRNTDFEDCGGTFYFDKEDKSKDFVQDDLSLWFNTVNGLVIICGCCHSGIVNTIRHASCIATSQEIYGIAGGLHLVNADQIRLDATVNEFQRHDIRRIVLCHCTGDLSSDYLKKHFPDKVINGFTGQNIIF